MIIPGKLDKGILIERENRFIAFVKYNNREVRCHLPNPGRMVEFLHPGKTVYIRFHNAKHRKTEATLVAIDFDGEIIQLDSNLVAKLIPDSMNHEVFSSYSIKGQEVTVGNHRFDYIFEENTEEILVEVKSTTRIVDGVACFPDAISKRASDHLSSLITLSKDQRCMVIFMVYRPAISFSPCYDIDKKFSEVFDQAVGKVEILVVQCSSRIVKQDEILLDVSVDNLIQKF